MVTPKHQACITLVREHAATVGASTTWGTPVVRAQHAAAWNYPTKFGERATKSAIEAYAYYADDYYDSFETELGTDGYFGGHARDMLRAINASLSMAFKSRLDSGAIHRLLRQLADVSGVDPDKL